MAVRKYSMHTEEYGTAGRRMFLVLVMGIVFGIVVYAYTANAILMHTLAIRQTAAQMGALEGEVRELDAEIAQRFITGMVAEGAVRMGLQDTGPVHFIHRDASVARAGN